MTQIVVPYDKNFTDIKQKSLIRNLPLAEFVKLISVLQSSISIIYTFSKLEVKNMNFQKNEASGQLLFRKSKLTISSNGYFANSSLLAVFLLYGDRNINIGI